MPVYRHLIRARAAALQGSSVVDREHVRCMAYERVSSIWKSGVLAAEFGDPLRSFVDSLPQSVVLATAAHSGLVGPIGSIEPLGVSDGAVFAFVARASYAAR